MAAAANSPPYFEWDGQPAAAMSCLLLWSAPVASQCWGELLAVQAGSAGPAVSALVVLHYNMPAFGHRGAFAAGRPAGRTACFCILPMSCLSCFAHTGIRPYLQPCVWAFALWQAASGGRNMTGTYAMAVAFSQAPMVRPGGLAGTWGPVLTGLWHASAAASSGCQA